MAALLLPRPRTAEELDSLDDPSDNVNDGAMKACAWCDKEAAPDVKLNKCSLCMAVAYCGRDCQRMHWKSGKGRHPKHKLICVKLQDKAGAAAEVVAAVTGDWGDLQPYDDPRLKYDALVYRAACDGGLHAHLLGRMEAAAATAPATAPAVRPVSDADALLHATVCSALQCLFNASRLRQRPTVSAADEARVRRFLRFERARCLPAWLGAAAAACRLHFDGSTAPLADMARGTLALTTFALTHPRVAAFALSSDLLEDKEEELGGKGAGEEKEEEEEEGRGHRPNRNRAAASSWSTLAAAVGHCNAYGADFARASRGCESGGAVRNWALVAAAVLFEQAAALKDQELQEHEDEQEGGQEGEGVAKEKEGSSSSSGGGGGGGGGRSSSKSGGSGSGSRSSSGGCFYGSEGQRWAAARLSEAALLGVPQALVDDLRDPAKQGQPWRAASQAEAAHYTAFLEWRTQIRASELVAP
jgi:uncharacterized membrane protein YgcG